MIFTSPYAAKYMFISDAIRHMNVHNQRNIDTMLYVTQDADGWYYATMFPHPDDKIVIYPCCVRMGYNPFISSLQLT